MVRLPIPGRDNDNWGELLNEFLEVGHRPDGNVKGATGIINIKDYGAVGDGVNDDTEAIQRAIDENRGGAQTPNLGTLTEVAQIVFPKGSYLIGQPLKTYTGIHLKGFGAGCKIVASSTFVGAGLIELTGLKAGPVHVYRAGSIDGLEFISAAGSGIAAIATTADSVANSSFRNLYFFCAQGLLLNTYTQMVLIENILSYGPADKILHLRGNFNVVRSINKESGSTGHSTDPYIFLESHEASPSNGNYFEHILIEGLTSPNKSAMILNGAINTTIHNFWSEPTETNGYALQIINSFGQTRVTGIFRGATAKTKINLINVNEVYFERLDTDGQDNDLATVLEVDLKSKVIIESLQTRRGSNIFKLDQSENIRILKHHNRTIVTSNLAGYDSTNEVHFSGNHNLLLNPSFEMGLYGWQINKLPSLEEYVQSEVSDGLMGHFQWNEDQIVNVSQKIQISSKWVNRPFTFTALVRVSAGSGWISPFLSGAGLAPNTSINRAYVGTGWQMISQTFRPIASGELFVGFYGINVSDFFVDQSNLTFGQIGFTNPNKGMSYELGGKSRLIGGMTPTSGTWKQGDIIWNESPEELGALNQKFVVLGWVCVAAGSPGAWVPIQTATGN